MANHLLTGATRGIGREVARLLGDDSLWLLGRDPVALDAVCRELPHARPVVADLADPDALQQALDAGELPDLLHGVIHCAGVSSYATIAEESPATWRHVLDVNVVAVAELTRWLLPRLRAAGGTVVVVNSGAGRAVRGPGRGVYSASKHAQVALADALRLEEPALRVVSVFPGRVATDMQRALRESEGAPYVPGDYISPSTLAEVVVGALRLPADGVVEEVVVMPPRS